MIAGSVDDRQSFAIYRWRPGTDHEKVAEIRGNINPEALILAGGVNFDDQESSLAGLSVISDDGSYVRNGVICRKRRPEEQSFRVRTWTGATFPN